MYANANFTAQQQHTISLIKDKFRELLNVEAINVVQGGPSIADPMGLVKHYVSFRDKRHNGFYLAVAEDGCIVEVGGQVGESKFKFPVTVSEMQTL